MMNIDSELVIITVHKGAIKDLIKTLKSIDNQILKPKLNIVVVSDVRLYEIKLFRNKKRIFIINKDKSIYNAMNIALVHKKTRGHPLLFLNSGDTLFNKTTIYHLNKHLKIGSPIVGKQLLNIKQYFFSIKKFAFLKRSYLPHGAFIAPKFRTQNFISRDFLFNEKNLIDGDGVWMRTIIKKNNQRIKKLNKSISIHSLGGISTNPTYYTLSYFFSIGFFSFLKELIKFFVKKIMIFPNIYYLTIYFIKYNVIKKND
jgi:hypothetical protein